MVCMPTRMISDSATFYDAFLVKIKSLPYILHLEIQFSSTLKICILLNQRREVIEYHSDYFKKQNPCSRGARVTLLIELSDRRKEMIVIGVKSQRIQIA